MPCNDAEAAGNIIYYSSGGSQMGGVLYRSMSAWMGA